MDVTDSVPAPPPGREVPRNDPFPQRFVLDGEGLGGRLKARPEDFIVEEIPRYDPNGEGEHLYLLVRKSGLSHGDAMRALGRHFGVADRSIGFAGMKDKNAVTTQWFSIHTRQDHSLNRVIHDRMTVLSAARHGNKLRRGHLVGNRFVIRVREVDPLRAPMVARQVKRLEALGAPNYFGEQRFGYRRNNHVLGSLILSRRWEEFIDELVGTNGSPFPAYQKKRRELYGRSSFAEAADLWSGSFFAERTVLRELARGRDSRRACLAIGRPMLSFFVNAAQSAIFNRLLDDRIASGAYAALEPGDLAWKHDSRSVFAVTEEDLRSDLLTPRLANFEVSPSGPLWGAGMIRASAAAGARELAALHEAGLDEASLEDAPCTAEGARRPMRVRVEHPVVDAGVDEHGGFVRLAFDLERGAYATIVLREIMKREIEDAPDSD